MTDRQLMQQVLAALEVGHEYAVETTEHFHIEMAGYKQQRHDAMDAEVKQIADAVAALRERLAEQPAQRTFDERVYLAMVAISNASFGEIQPTFEEMKAAIEAADGKVNA